MPLRGLCLLFSTYDKTPFRNSPRKALLIPIQIGQMVGALFVWISDWQGRKLAIFVGCVGVCIGAIVTATAPTLGGFIGGRFLLSFFSSIAVTASPLILIEIAPPQYRATVSGIYNTLYYFVSIHYPSRGVPSSRSRVLSLLVVLYTELTSPLHLVELSLNGVYLCGFN